MTRTADVLPVSPAAHYHRDRIDADIDAKTSVDGLGAVGESSSTGAHGAHRLASSALLEGLVFGACVALDVGRRKETPEGEVLGPKETPDLPVIAGPTLEDLRQLLWDRVGFIRTGDGLWEARQALMSLEDVLSRTIQGRNAISLALLTVMAALRHSETRGGHYRADHPDANPMPAIRALLDPGMADIVVVPS